MKTVYVDMDGVLVDFISIAERMDSFDTIDDPDGQFWSDVETLGPSWWSDLPWCENGLRLWNSILRIKCNIRILSAAPELGYYQGCSGKRYWLSHNLDSIHANQAIITHRKNKVDYTNPNSILIDDWSKNVNEWRVAGGSAIHHENNEDTMYQLGVMLG